MPLKIENGKAADKAKSVDVHRKLTEEVNDGGCAFWKGEPEDEGGQHNRNELICKRDDFHRKQLSERLMDLNNTTCPLVTSQS